MRRLIESTHIYYFETASVVRRWHVRRVGTGQIVLVFDRKITEAPKENVYIYSYRSTITLGTQTKISFEKQMQAVARLSRDRITKVFITCLEENANRMDWRSCIIIALVPYRSRKPMHQQPMEAPDASWASWTDTSIENYQPSVSKWKVHPSAQTLHFKNAP